MFKRRTPRSLLQRLGDFLWPRGGWARAASYVGHRLRRLPDRPEKIARGVFAGVFTAFTPFFGLHFVVAVALAKVMRGNLLAALLGTFIGNPLSYVPIALISLKTGHYLMGSRLSQTVEKSVLRSFVDAGRDLRNNLMAIFTGQDANWHNLSQFYDQVFLPYLVGGIIPGLVAAMFCYHLTVVVVSAYQKRRKKRLAAKLAELRKQGRETSEDGITSN
ncbi:hypothetical protein BV394_10455 [Brevirhabdus pacifica]|uniref:Uncharacterized protein n=1 Tax=Brevirhabdus pacifica TaxID=1267768 RepID=A0A1U7DJP4_9RHOB|nr:DUF2062 domain-containing protein [Brevirhabdus pacifica]APX90088.1 hypothetical protein BV394_10455 [Brevirhabdus pacifica]OWU75322.1 hypothetical protein ATO5_11940 [Loktanella sp. 22II-4b]PJJ82659.1 hypothetical protein CLV77_2433 [Brevirhabdus pacifica]